MFRYNIPKSLITEVKNELELDIDSKHPSVEELRKQVEKVSSRQAMLIGACVLLWVLFFKLPGDIHGLKNLSLGDSLFDILFDLLFFPVFYSIFAKCISMLFFYYKNDIPLKQTPPSSSSRKFSSKASCSSSISINPASGLPMSGSIDVSGNAPGHSHHY